MYSEVADKLAEFETPEEAVSSGLFLFHGTVEDFSGPLKPGGYDGVIWTTNLPTVAQTYIPENGLSTLLHYVDFRADDRVRPSKSDAWWNVVARAMGIDTDACDVKYDSFGDAVSYTIVDGHPTYREARTFLESLGYRFKDEILWIKTEYRDGQEVLLPSDFRRQGRLFILLKNSDLNFYDLRDGEGDLTCPDHQRLSAFAQARDTGYDGIVINDFAQSPKWGNVGHTSWGLFDNVIEAVPCLEIPAVAYDWKDSLFEDGGVTPDFRSAFEEIKLARSSTPSII